jgi:hypothetical protein
MVAKDYIDPKGYWCDPSGNIRRMGNEDGEQEIIATATEVCSEAEWKNTLRCAGQSGSYDRGAVNCYNCFLPFFLLPDRRTQWQIYPQSDFLAMKTKLI